jgi:hypothetical protein
MSTTCDAGPCGTTSGVVDVEVVGTVSDVDDEVEVGGSYKELKTNAPVFLAFSCVVLS